MKITVSAMIPARVTFPARHALAPLIREVREAAEGDSNDEEIEALQNLVGEMLYMLNINEEG